MGMCLCYTSGVVPLCVWVGVCVRLCVGGCVGVCVRLCVGMCLCYTSGVVLNQVAVRISRHIVCVAT